MIGPLGRLGAAATLGQHCPQMTQRPGTLHTLPCELYFDFYEPAQQALRSEWLNPPRSKGWSPCGVKMLCNIFRTKSAKRTRQVLEVLEFNLRCLEGEAAAIGYE